MIDHLTSATLKHLRNLGNSVIVTIIGATVKVVLAITTAYALVFIRVPGVNLIFLGILVALMVPPEHAAVSTNAAEEANGNGTDHRIAIWSLTRTATLLTANPQPVLRNSIINVGTYSISPKADQKPGPFPLGQCINDTTLPTIFGPGCWQIFFVQEPDHDEVISRPDSLDGRMQQVWFVNGSLWGAAGTGVGAKPGGPQTTW